MLHGILIFAYVNLNILFEYIDSGIKFDNNNYNQEFPHFIVGVGGGGGGVFIIYLGGKWPSGLIHHIPLSRMTGLIHK